MARVVALFFKKACVGGRQTPPPHPMGSDEEEGGMPPEEPRGEEGQLHGEPDASHKDEEEAVPHQGALTIGGRGKHHQPVLRVLVVVH